MMCFKYNKLIVCITMICSVCAGTFTNYSQTWAQEDIIPDMTETDITQPSTDQEMHGDISVSPYLSVTIHVQDTELATVLRMLSMQSQKNIIANSNVSASVTADLYDVTFYEALDAILHANGYGYIEEGNFLYVYTQEEMKTILEAKRKMNTRVFTTNYLSATDASVFVSQILSENGSIAINGEAAPGFEADVNDGGANNWAYTSTLVVKDYDENLDEIGKLLTQIDTRPQQVLVEATVLQTTLTEGNAWGLDFSILSDMNFTDITDPLSAVDNLINGSNATSGFQPSDNKGFGVQNGIGRTGSAGGLKIGVVSEDISVFLRVLDEVTDSTILSRPKILALNRNRGKIHIGKKLGYISTTATETSSTQTVEFLDTGTTLVFRPFVGNDGFIRLELNPRVSVGVIREATTADGQAMTIPDEITQELTTNVTVNSGHTIVLGGLFREETTLSRRQVPFLGDIPLIGAAFRGHDDTTVRSEIMFLITPTIMKDEVLASIGEDAKIYVERARVGIRKGVLPWSNDRLTAQHNMKAEQYLRDGDIQMALWEINQSLSLKATQPMVIALREDITGTRDGLFNRSALDKMLRKHLNQTVSDSKDSNSSAITIQEPAPQIPAESDTALLWETPEVVNTDNPTAVSMDGEWTQLDADKYTQANMINDANYTTDDNNQTPESLTFLERWHLFQSIAGINEYSDPMPLDE